VFVCRLPFRSSKGPLAPSLEMCYQAKFKKTVDLAKCLGVAGVGRRGRAAVTYCKLKKRCLNAAVFRS
jgi:hypothetical protein